MAEKMKPHVFRPGIHRGFPGPYCRHCHFSKRHADPRGCPKRYHWPRVKKITDKEMLDWLIEGHYHVESHKGHYWVYPDAADGSSHPIGTSARAAISAAMCAERRAKKGE